MIRLLPPSNDGTFNDNKRQFERKKRGEFTLRDLTTKKSETKGEDDRGENEGEEEEEENTKRCGNPLPSFSMYY